MKMTLSFLPVSHFLIVEKVNSSENTFQKMEMIMGLTILQESELLSLREDLRVGKGK